MSETPLLSSLRLPEDIPGLSPAQKADVMMDEEDIVLLGKDIELLPDEINSIWKEYE